MICSHTSLVILYSVLVLASIGSIYIDNETACSIFSVLFHFMSLVYVMWIFTECLHYTVKLRSRGVRGSKITGCLAFFMCLMTFGKQHDCQCSIRMIIDNSLLIIFRITFSDCRCVGRY